MDKQTKDQISIDERKECTGMTKKKKKNEE